MLLVIGLVIILVSILVWYMMGSGTVPNTAIIGELPTSNVPATTDPTSDQGFSNEAPPPPEKEVSGTVEIIPGEHPVFLNGRVGARIMMNKLIRLYQGLNWIVKVNGNYDMDVSSPYTIVHVNGIDYTMKPTSRPIRYEIRGVKDGEIVTIKSGEKEITQELVAAFKSSLDAGYIVFIDNGSNSVYMYPGTNPVVL